MKFKNQDELQKWHEQQMAKATLKAKYNEMRNQQKEVEHKFKHKIETGKIFFYLIALNCTLIEAYCMWITYKALVLVGAVEFGAIIALLGAILSESFAYFTYSKKSTAENTKGGIVYDVAMQNQSCSDENNGKGVG